MPFHTLLEKPIKPTIYKKDWVNGFFLSALKKPAYRVVF
jgi:hypothetical protein